MGLNTRFVATDLDNHTVVRKPSIESLMAWLTENTYFDQHPEQILFLTEEFTRHFEVQITPGSSLQEVREAWNSFNGFI